MDTLNTIFEAVREKARSHEKNFAALDFDNTCIHKDVGEATLAYVCKNKLLKSKTLIPGEFKNDTEYHEKVFQHYYELLKTDMLGAYLFCAKIFAGFTKIEAERVVSDAIAAEGEALGNMELYGISIAHGITPRAIMRELIKFLQDEGVDIWIVSASPRVCVEGAMRHFDFPGNLIGLTNKIEGDVFTVEIIEPYSIAEGKVECVKKYIEPSARPILGAGDSMNDFPMVEYAEIHVAIDRGNAFTKEAQVREWFVL